MNAPGSTWKALKGGSAKMSILISRFSHILIFEENMHQDKINPGNNNANIKMQPLINSCLALGSSLLSQYDTSGDKRMDDLNEEEFEKNVKNFFDTAECHLKDGNE